MKKILLFLCLPIFGQAQNTIGGNAILVPEEEVDRQSRFIEADRERILGNYDKAADAFQKFLYDNPKNDAAWYELSQVYSALKDQTKANDAIQHALAIDPLNKWYQIRQADLFEEAGRIKDACKVYEQLTKDNPKTPEFFEQLGYLYVLDGNPKKGIETYNRLEKMVGITEETTAKKQLIYTAMGDMDKAAAELRRLADAYPSEVKYLHNLAEFYEKNGKKDQAKGVYTEILKKSPNDAAAKIALVSQNNSTGDGAKIAALKPLFADPTAQIDVKIKEIVPYFEKLEKTKDVSLQAPLAELGEILTQTHPDDPKSWSVAGDLYYLSNKPQEALAKYRRCIQLNPKVFSVWDNLLQILSDTKAYPEMRTTAEKAMDAFPNQAKAVYHYGIASLQTNQAADALAPLEQATLMTGQNLALKWDIYELLAACYMADNQYDKAKLKLESTFGKGGDKHPGILKKYIEVLEKMGQNDAAQPYREKLRMLN